MEHLLVMGKAIYNPGVVTHARNPSIPEIKAEASE